MVLLKKEDSEWMRAQRGLNVSLYSQGLGSRHRHVEATILQEALTLGEAIEGRVEFLQDVWERKRDGKYLLAYSGKAHRHFSIKWSLLAKLQRGCWMKNVSSIQGGCTPKECHDIICWDRHLVDMWNAAMPQDHGTGDVMSCALGVHWSLSPKMWQKWVLCEIISVGKLLWKYSVAS